MDGQKTAFVTGATGFLGINLVQQLDAAGWRTIAFHRLTSDTSELEKLPSVECVVGDVRDADSLLRALPEEVDAVFHTAGSVGFLERHEEENQYRVNVLGTRNTVQAALERRAKRFIYTSSVLTYRFEDCGRVDESTPANADSPFSYVRTKYLGELEVEEGQRAGLDTVVLHPSAIFGAHDKVTWSKLFREVDRGLRVPFAPPGGASFCHMREVAGAHLLAYDKGRSGEHYVLGGPDADFRQVAATVAGLLGKRSWHVTIPGWLFRLLGRIEYEFSRLLDREPMVTPAMADMLCLTVLCSSEKAIDELGYRPSSIETALTDCYQWMQREGLLGQRAVRRSGHLQFVSDVDAGHKGAALTLNATSNPGSQGADVAADNS